MDGRQRIYDRINPRKMKNITCFLFLIMAYQGQSFAQPARMLLQDNWKAKRAIDVLSDGTEITSPGFKPEGWLDAVVPGTILTTLMHNGLVPDPFFGMNNNLIPDVYDAGRDYYTYWFHTEFALPQTAEGQEVWLNFRGINYFADVFLNGNRVNTRTHKGMYLRERYRITPYINKSGINRLAVWVAPPDPVGNAFTGQGGDGMVGRNITMQCTAGWDWICPIRDRNTGIWDQVSIETTGAVDLRNPYIESRVPGKRIPGDSQESAWVSASVELLNVSEKPVQGSAKVVLNGKEFSQKVTLNPGELKTIQFREIEVAEPMLWWPNGMGDQPLYTLHCAFNLQDGSVSDSEKVSFGIREAGHYFDDQIRAQVFTVNGQKVFIKGGNWIASDALLRLTRDRYDAEIRMHAGMNMNMIRVWGGGLTERPDFYDACDRYGILVWQDLWVSGDCNGEWLDPSKKESQARRKAYPDDHPLFIESVIDQVKMLRNHPSLYLWCGGNETPPPADINQALEKEILPQLDPKRFYLDKSTSARLMTNSKGGTGDGPYGIQEPAYWFTERSFPFNPETGSIGIPNIEGLKRFIPADELFPPESQRGSKSWLYHKYQSLNNFPARYGKVKDIADYCMKTQMVSYEQYRALQEGFNYKMWEWYTGMLIWKNQNPWTALRGNFYDYFLDYTGGYFGYQHGAEPVHIQLNMNDSVVCLLNQTAQSTGNLTASIQLFDMHGKIISQQKQDVTLEAHKTMLLNKVILPDHDSSVYFLRLTLLNKDKVVDENLYWLAGKPPSYEHLNALGKANLEIAINKTSPGLATISVSNPGNETAFFIRLKLVNEDNELALPVFLSDNYITLFPGETKILKLDYSVPLRDGLKPVKLVAEGWNLAPKETGL
jgi:mannosylglycoprotein endo-beta-mannosidase